MITQLSFDPLLPWSLFIGLSLSLLLMTLLSIRYHLPSTILRLLASLCLLLALANPQTKSEHREPLKDIVLVLYDQSASTQISTRSALMAQTQEALMQKLQNQNSQLPTGLEIVTHIIPDENDGTHLSASLLKALSDIPEQRLAAVIALTDGQIHDLPPVLDGLLPENIPFHALIIGNPQNRDRRLKAITAPQYGLVDETADFTVRVEDPGHEGEIVQIDVRLNGQYQAKFPAIIGENIDLPVKIERRGRNLVELTIPALEDELTHLNNRFVSEFSSIRDRLQVLLITGNPHIGGRAWRNLLKSDPSVDLVQFTILTNPLIKNTHATQNELSLIPFPTRQLFEETLDSFDLIIFDQFQRRFRPGGSGRISAILQPYYLYKIAKYVEGGGALLIAAGPAFAGSQSLYRSPLSAILPAHPSGDITLMRFQPKLNEIGRRHPITSIFQGNEAQNWGDWYRLINNRVVSGHVLIEGADGMPLLVIDEAGQGRVAMLLSDQAWLWAKNYHGGGPYNGMFRRLAHWLMEEPDLESEQLTGHIENQRLIVQRRTLNDQPQSLRITDPNGQIQNLVLERISEGLYQGEINAPKQGIYHLAQSDIQTIIAASSLNPEEFADLQVTREKLAPLVHQSGGSLFEIPNARAPLPDIKRVKPQQIKPNRTTETLDLVTHNQYRITATQTRPWLPGLLFFLFIAPFILTAWWRESR